MSEQCNNIIHYDTRWFNKQFFARAAKLFKRLNARTISRRLGSGKLEWTQLV